MRSNIYSLITAFLSLTTVVTAIATAISSGDLDLSNDVLISSYTLDSGVGIMVFAPKNETSVLAARDSSPASPAPGTLQKRLDIQGWSCTTQCGPTDVLGPNNNDCVNLYNGLYAQSGTFSVATGNRFIAWVGDCAAALVNNYSEQSISYDYHSFAGTTQWLNGECIVNRHLGRGLCLYNILKTTTSNGVYTIVSRKSYWGL